MQREAHIQALSREEIEFVSGAAVSLSPSQLAHGRAIVKGTDGSTPEESASFFGKWVMGLIKL